VCSRRKRTNTSVFPGVALPLRTQPFGGLDMLMFKRSQIYIGLGLAAVVEIVIRVVAH